MVAEVREKQRMRFALVFTRKPAVPVPPPVRDIFDGEDLLSWRRGMRVYRVFRLPIVIS
jgi:hypothetical protein